MIEKSALVTLHQIIALVSIVALFAISCYYSVLTTLWLIRIRYSFISTFWGESFKQALTFTDVTHFIAFIALLISTIRAKSLIFEPSQFLLYIIVLWITASSFLVIEINPSRWKERISQIQEYLISNPNSESTNEFIDFLKCNQTSNDCWEKIEVFVDEKFCGYSGLFLPVFPLLVGFSIVFLI